MTTSSHYRRLVWILPVAILLLAFYNIARSFEIKLWWTNKLKNHQYYISTTFDIPGYGNLMFQYASLVGIAAKSGKNAVLPSSMKLCNIFEIPELKWNLSRPGEEWGKVVEKQHSAYDSKVDNLQFDHNIEVVGYLQSWKYFEGYESQLRKSFTFKDSILTNAESFLQNVSATLKKNSPNPLYVGVHVRRGDFLKKQFVQHGYTVADKDYIEKAMKHFEKKYSQNSVIYVVASDDLPWCKQNMPSSENVIFSENHISAVDLAVMSLCNHTIMTVGTFGWWSAWLAGGDVIYYKNFPLLNSRLSNSFSQSKDDYFPPQWIGF